MANKFFKLAKAVSVAAILASCGAEQNSDLTSTGKNLEEKKIQYKVLRNIEIESPYYGEGSCLLKQGTILTLKNHPSNSSVVMITIKSMKAPIEVEVASADSGVNHLKTDLLASSDEYCSESNEFIFAQYVTMESDALELVKISEIPVQKPRVAETVVDKKASVPMANGLSRNMNAFLDTIAFAEGTRDRYDISFTFKPFYGYSSHPRALYCSYGLCSDAAGRYQFLSTTWDTVARKLRLPDFSPASQDKAAVELIKMRGAKNLVEAINGPASLERALRKCSYEWASLPGSPYGQPVKTASQLWNVFSKSLAKY